MKRILSMLIAVAAFLSVSTGAGAARYAVGFVRDGSFSDTRTSFGFVTDESVMVYNKDAYEDPDYDEVYPGSFIYVPIYRMGTSGADDAIATDKDIKDNQVTVSWKGTLNERYIDDVTLVNGKKEKIDGLVSGAYAKIFVNQEYTGLNQTQVEVKVVLSVKRNACPETEFVLRFDLMNREVWIESDTVYTAKSPTRFYAMKHYGGKATFDFGDRIRYTTQVRKGERYYLHLDRSDNPSISDMYEDAYLEFYDFKGDRDTFAAVGQLEIPIDRQKFTPKGESKAQVFVYEISGTSLKSLDGDSLSFDGRRNMLTINTKSLNNYVLSDRALLREVTEDDDDIIYTGYAKPEDTGTDGSAPDKASTGTSGTASTARQPDAVNDNVNTGRAINAANNAADNPLTGDGRPLSAAVSLAAASGALVYGGWKRKWYRNEEDEQ